MYMWNVNLDTKSNDEIMQNLFYNTSDTQYTLK